MPHEAIVTPWNVVLERCQRLTDMQVWDVGARLDPAGWYSNFLAHEQEHAAALLNRFLYFNREVMAALMTSAIRNRADVEAEISLNQRVIRHRLDIVLTGHDGLAVPCPLDGDDVLVDPHPLKQWRVRPR